MAARYVAARLRRPSLISSAGPTINDLDRAIRLKLHHLSDVQHRLVTQSGIEVARLGVALEFARICVYGHDVTVGLCAGDLGMRENVSSILLSALRIMAGLLFLQHGTTKYLSLPVTKHSGVDPAALSGIAGMIELVCGALLVIGLLTRPAAFLASGTMAAAYFLAHAKQNFYPILNGGELAALYCFVFLYLSAAGGGLVSVDQLIWGHSTTRRPK